MEIIQKLRSLTTNTHYDTEILDSLAANKFWDEKRFIKQYIHDKFYISHWGKMKIKRGLDARMINVHLYEEDINKLDDNEYYQKMFYHIERKKASLSNAESPYIAKDKIFRYVCAKGFEPDSIWTALNGLIPT